MQEVDLKTKLRKEIKANRAKIAQYSKQVSSLKKKEKVEAEKFIEQINELMNSEGARSRLS